MQENISELVIIDEDSMTLINVETGEFLGCAEVPPEDVDTVKLAEWLGDRLQERGATLAGLEAEYQWQIDRINALYDSRIANQRNAIAWLKTKWETRLMELARSVISEGKRRSCVIGLLKLSLKKSRESTEVQDVARSVEWARKWCPDAIQVSEKVLVSKLTPDALAVVALRPEESGMVYHPAGERESLVLE